MVVRVKAASPAAPCAGRWRTAVDVTLRQLDDCVLLRARARVEWLARKPSVFLRKAIESAAPRIALVRAVATHAFEVHVLPAWGGRVPEYVEGSGPRRSVPAQALDEYRALAAWLVSRDGDGAATRRRRRRRAVAFVAFLGLALAAGAAARGDA